MLIRAFIVSFSLTAALLSVAIPAPTVTIHVRWIEGLSGDARPELERRFSLQRGTPIERSTWRYSLQDFSPDNIRALVEHPAVADTHGVQRELFRPDIVPPGRSGRIVLGSVLAGAGAVLTLIAWSLVGVRARPRLRAVRIPVRTLAPPALIITVITLAYLPVLTSGEKVMLNHDFFQYASRHEAVVESIRRYHTLPLRSHWLGGGFQTVADPEDPTLNPLVLFSLLLGTVKGLKAIGYLSMLIGGLATYGFARRILGYTRWGALFSALVFGTCLFIPSRIAGGNPNEVYGAWLPLGLLLIGLALEGRRWPIVALSLVFYTMISDGKLTALMGMFYIGVLCLLAVFPSLRIFQAARADGRASAFDYRPAAYFLAAVGLCIVIGLPRLVPAFEVIGRSGGIAPMIAAHPQRYSAEGVHAYTFEELWEGALGWGRGVEPDMLNRDLVTVGTIPVVLTGIALLVFWRQTRPWAIVLLLFCWLILAHHAPIDLLARLWHLPVFDTIYRPYKYFSFQIAFTLAIVAGYTFHLLGELRSRRVEALIAAILIACSVGFLYPRSVSILSNTFTADAPPLVASKEFFNVGVEPFSSVGPHRALPYFNILRDVGTLTRFTPVRVSTKVVPKYFIGLDNRVIDNPDYRGEAYFLQPPEVARVVRPPVFEPNTTTVSVDIQAPATIVINQNYDREWRSDRGILSDYNGLIALHLTEPGSYAVRLRYRPRSFYAAVPLTGVALVGLIAFRWLLIYRKRSSIPVAPLVPGYPLSWALRRESPPVKAK